MGKTSVFCDVQVIYYALLRDEAGRAEEKIVTKSVTAAKLYEELANKYHFSLDMDRMRVAINAIFAGWETRLKSGDTVVFIPPVAGG